MNGPSRIIRSGLWQWLTGPGVERFELVREEGGWKVRGTIVALGESGPVEAVYSWSCDEAWQTKRAEIALRDESGDKVDVIHSVLRRESRLQGCRFGFEFWTCGNFDADVVSYLATVRSSRPKLNLGWRDGVAVRQYAATTNKKSVLDTLDEHSFRNPLKTFEKKNAPVPSFDEMTVEL